MILVAAEVDVVFSVQVLMCVACSCSSARAHGRKDVGLPSRLATFKTGSSLPGRKKPSWWQEPLSGDTLAPSLTTELKQRQQLVMWLCLLKCPKHQFREWSMLMDVVGHLFDDVVFICKYR